MTITHYGFKEIAISFLLLGLMTFGFCMVAVKVHPAFYAGAVCTAIVFLWVLSFFRNPTRTIPQDADSFVSPADGVVTHIEEVDEPDFIGGRALRVSIFLSIFNVHLNRTPLAGKVAYKQYKKGEFVNAMRGDSGHLNERTDLGIIPDDSRVDKLMIRQIAGLIARRIVCDTEIGNTLQKGEIYGMIKFSSRTEIYLPADTKLSLNVKIGDPVQAGSTILGVLS